MKTTTGLASISFWIWSFTLPSAANFLRCGMKSLSEQSVRAGPGRAAASRAAANRPQGARVAVSASLRTSMACEASPKTFFRYKIRAPWRPFSFFLSFLNKILLVQVGTLSFSHPLFGVSVLFIYLDAHPSLVGPFCLFSFILSVAMRSPLPFPCVPDRPSKTLLVQVGPCPRPIPRFEEGVKYVCLR